MNRTKTLAIALLFTQLNCAPCLAGMPFYQSLSPSDANTEKMLNKELSDANNAKAKGYKISDPLHAWTLLNLARVKEYKNDPGRANSLLELGSDDDSGRSGWPLAIDWAMDLKAACLMKMNRTGGAARIYFDELNVVKRVGNAYVKKSMLSSLRKKGDQMAISSRNPEQYLANFEKVAKSNLSRPIRTPSSPPGYDFCRFK